MTRIAVADTDPLSALARVEQLELLHSLSDEVLIPPAVHSELAIGSDRPSAKRLARALEAGWLVVRSPNSPDSVLELVRLLDGGEAEAIALAEQRSVQNLIIDDAKGRRIARRRGIAVIGVAGVLLACKSQGSLAAFGPILEALSQDGCRPSPQLTAGVLDRAGE